MPAPLGQHLSHTPLEQEILASRRQNHTPGLDLTRLEPLADESHPPPPIQDGRHVAVAVVAQRVSDGHRLGAPAIHDASPDPFEPENAQKPLQHRIWFDLS